MVQPSMQMKEKLILKQHLDVSVGFDSLIDVFHVFTWSYEQRSSCFEGDKLRKHPSQTKI
jgi:hypothetical protein